MLSQIKAGRAYQVADVFDKDDVETIEIQVVQGLMNHMGIEVTGTAGRNLYRLHTVFAYAFGIVFCFQIAFDDCDGQVPECT